MKGYITCGHKSTTTQCSFKEMLNKSPDIRLNYIYIFEQQNDFHASLL